MKCLAKAEQAVTSAFLVAFAFAGVLAVGADAGTAPTDKVGNTFQVMEFTDGLNEFFFGAQLSLAA